MKMKRPVKIFLGVVLVLVLVFGALFFVDSGGPKMTPRYHVGEAVRLRMADVGGMVVKIKAYRHDCIYQVKIYYIYRYYSGKYRHLNQGIDVEYEWFHEYELVSLDRRR